MLGKKIIVILILKIEKPYIRFCTGLILYLDNTNTTNLLLSALKYDWLLSCHHLFFAGLNGKLWQLLHFMKNTYCSSNSENICL